MTSEAIEAAQRIIDKATPPSKRPTITELEAILTQPDGPPVSINADGSIGVGPSDALIVARALLASDLRADRDAVLEGSVQLEEIVNEVKETLSPMPHVYRQGWQDACEKVRREVYRRIGRVNGLVREVVVDASLAPEAFNAGIVAAADKVRSCIDGWRLHGSIDEYGIDLLATAENSIRALKAEGSNPSSPRGESVVAQPQTASRSPTADRSAQ